MTVRQGEWPFRSFFVPSLVVARSRQWVGHPCTQCSARMCVARFAAIEPAGAIPYLDPRFACHVRMGQYLPLCSRLSIGASVFVAVLKDANVGNLAPPHLLPNIDSGGQGA